MLNSFFFFKFILALFIDSPQDKLELSANQQLIHEYGDVKVFDVNGAVYCTLIMKAEDSRIKLGIFELTINGGSVHFKSVN